MPTTNNNQETEWILLEGVVKKGHRVASGLANNSPYSRGSIEMQKPFFRQLGLDLSSFFSGTLNISIYPKTFQIKQSKYTFRQVKWHSLYPAEDFSFLPCQVLYQEKSYNSWIYYPHPETKIGHFQDASTLEVIAPFIPQLNYDMRVNLKIKSQAILIQ
jgi:hypothetical protein